MIRYFIGALLLLIVGAIIQQWIPPFGDSFYSSKVLLVPLIFFCSAHILTYSQTLVLAFFTGLFWDAEHIIAPYYETTQIELDTVDNLKFGYSIFLFGLLGFFIKLLQALIPLRGMLIFTPIVFLSFILYLLLENLMILFVRGTLTYDHRFLFKVFFITLFSSTLSPLFFVLLDKMRKALKPRNEIYKKTCSLIIARTSK